MYLYAASMMQLTILGQVAPTRAASHHAHSSKTLTSASSLGSVGNSWVPLLGNFLSKNSDTTLDSMSVASPSTRRGTWQA